MRIVAAILKFALISAIAAIVMALAGYMLAVLLMPLLVPGNNPHTDAYAALGVAMIFSAAGALIGVVGVIVWTIRSARRTSNIPGEILP